ncbi:MAG: enolase C-terminal domain-like protein [Vulcanimicrobiaceae bacterium]
MSVPEATARIRVLDDEGLYCIEEPTRADDFEGHARIAAYARTPIQLGENWWGPHDMSKSSRRGGVCHATRNVERRAPVRLRRGSLGQHARMLGEGERVSRSASAR